MADPSTTKLPWRVQWHVAADGTVIRERSRGDEAHQQLFETFATTRPVSVEELDALSERRITAFDALWYGGLLVLVGGLMAAGGLVGHGQGGLPGLLVGLVLGLSLASAVSVAVFWLVMVLLPDDTVGWGQRRWRDAGLVSSAGVTMKAVQARALLDAPGATSGVERRVERA